MIKDYTNPLVSLHEINMQILTKESPESILEEILDQAVQTTSADSGNISLLDEERKNLEIRVFRGLDKTVPDQVKLKVGEGVTGRCIMTGRSRNIGDTSKDPYYIAIRSDIKSELAVPLQVGGKSFGVITVDSSKKEAFTDADVDFIELLASFASQIYANQLTLSNLKERTKMLEALIEASQELGKSPSIDEVFERIVSFLSAKLSIQNATIFLYDPVPGELYIAAGSNLKPGDKQSTRYRPGEGITGAVFEKEEFIAIPEISKNENFLNKSGRERPDTKTSFFACPLSLDGEVIGVFSMEAPYTGQSSFEDRSFLAQLLATMLSQALRIQRLLESQARDIQFENAVLKRQLEEKYSFGNIIGSSEKMQELFSRIKMAADSSSSVLLYGESGTGKELLATALHQNSLRKDRPLVKINCAAIPGDLLESELFGHTKGAFTGATENRKGKFLAAHGGTIFLDEIGEMDYRLQSKLLRVLQEKEFTPLGSDQVFRVDVRIIAATNADLERLVKQKKFRADLYYRLNVVRIEVPPLRDRKSDLPALMQFLIHKIAKANGKKTKGFLPEVLTKLEGYDFPGNVRELENLLERAVVLSNKLYLEPDDIVLPDRNEKSVQAQETPRRPESLAKPEPEAESLTPDESMRNLIRDLIKQTDPGQYQKEIMSKFEKELILMLLKKNLMNKALTAREMGINRITLNKKIQEYKILEEFTL